MRSLISALLGLLGASKADARCASVLHDDRTDSDKADPTVEQSSDPVYDEQLAQLIPESPDRPLHVAFLMLHQPDPILEQRLPSVESLVAFNKQVELAFKEYLERMPESDGRTFSMICAIKPNRRSRFWIEYHPQPLEPTVHEALLEELSKVEPPIVHRGPVSYAIFGLLWGGIGRDQHPNFSMIPTEWNEYVGGVVPDDPLSKIWPD